MSLVGPALYFSYLVSVLGSQNGACGDGQCIGYGDFIGGSGVEEFAGVVEGQFRNDDVMCRDAFDMFKRVVCGRLGKIEGTREVDGRVDASEVVGEKHGVLQCPGLLGYTMGRSRCVGREDREVVETGKVVRVAGSGSEQCALGGTAEVNSTCQEACSEVPLVAQGTLRNRAKRKRNKERKERKKSGNGVSNIAVRCERDSEIPEWRRKKGNTGLDGVSMSGEVCDELKESVRQKWIAKNKLERLEAERKIFVLQSNDVDAEIKRYRTRVGVQTERNMVAMEKAHATLKATGNVPIDQVGDLDAGSRVCTLVSEKSGTISPDSSASQAEFRAVQKKNFDLEAQIEEMKQMFKQTGVSYEALKKADQMTFTDNTENGLIMDELYPKGIGCHYVVREGVSKLRIGCEDY